MAYALHINEAVRFVINDLSLDERCVSIQFYDKMRVEIGAVMFRNNSLTRFVDLLSKRNRPSSRSIPPNCQKDKIIIECTGDASVRIISQFGPAPWPCVLLDEYLATKLLGRLESIVTKTMKPRSTCKECNGTGKIVLFTSVRDCDCGRG